MAQNPLAPPPPGSSPEQDRWLFLLYRRLTQAGQILWSSLDFGGSNITDLETRNHNDLQTLQGGATGEQYHVTQADYAEILRANNTLEVTSNLALTDAHCTVWLTLTGLTITLPEATLARVGRTWSVMLATTGTGTVTCAGAASFAAPTSATETTIILTARGQSVVFKCLDEDKWGLE